MYSARCGEYGLRKRGKDALHEYCVSLDCLFVHRTNKDVYIILSVYRRENNGHIISEQHIDQRI